MGIARAKGMLCFAGKKKDEDDTEQAMDKEGSDAESAENHSTKADTKDSKDGACAEDEKTHNDTSNTTDNKKESHKTSVAAKMTNFFAAMKKSFNSKSSKE